MLEGGEKQSNKVAQASVVHPGAITNERSLNTVYSQCVSSYQQFLIRFSTEDYFESNEGLGKYYDEYSRLKIWGYQRKAALGPSVPGSLAATLLDYPDLETAVLEIYGQIIQNFDRLALLPLESLVVSLNFLIIESKTDDDSETRSQISESSSHGGNTDTGSEILAYIFEGIEELYRLNNLIRRPRLTGRHLHSVQSGATQPHQEDLQHIKQNLLQWKEDQKYKRMQEEVMKPAELERAQPIEGESEEVATLKVIPERQSTEEIATLSHRLAVANMKRRKQFSYWDTHPYQLDCEPVKHKTAPAVAHETTGPPPKEFTFLSVAKPATVSDQYKARHKQDKNTIYAPTSVGIFSSSRVPDPPLLDNSRGSLECPYCHIGLPVDEMRIRENWKRHVFRDLRPYVCTFLDCPDPERLFATRHDWIYHEMQLHRREWDCQQCGHHYASKSEMADHIRRVHYSDMKGRELALLLDISERPIDEGRYDKCPFCFAIMGMKSLLDHMACHMEELALFSLPPEHVESTEAEEALSHSADTPLPDTSARNETSTDSQSDTQPESSNKNEGMGEKRDGGVPAEPVPYITHSGFKGGGSIGSRNFFCCNCGHGPWYSKIDPYCHNCQHRQCIRCPIVA